MLKNVDKDQLHEWLENNQEYIKDQITGIDRKRDQYKYDEFRQQMRKEHPEIDQEELEKVFGPVNDRLNDGIGKVVK